MTKSTGRRAALAAEAVHERFKRLLQPGAPDECWAWPTINGVGYGVFRHHRKDYYAHRVAYEVAHGPIPEGMMVCHHCDFRPCANDAHLFVGTAADNTADMMAKGRGRPVGVEGVEHPLAKLDEEKVRYIRSSGATLPKLAAELGVAVSLVHRVKTRQSWKHVA